MPDTMPRNSQKLTVKGSFYRPLAISDHAILRCAQRFINTEISAGGICRESTLGRKCIRQIRRLIKDSALMVPSEHKNGEYYIYCGTRRLVVCDHVVITVYIHRRRLPGIEELDRLLQAA